MKWIAIGAKANSVHCARSNCCFTVDSLVFVIAAYSVRLANTSRRQGCTSIGLPYEGYRALLFRVLSEPHPIGPYEWFGRTGFEPSHDDN